MLDAGTELSRKPRVSLKHCLRQASLFASVDFFGFIPEVLELIAVERIFVESNSG